MKSAIPHIHSYTISDMSADTGRKNPAKDFHVFRNDEFIYNEKMISHPIRADHFIILLVLRGEAQIELNHINYNLTKNSLFTIPHSMVHQFKQNLNDFSINGIGFSRDFLGQAGLHKKHADSFDFFSSQSNPHLLLTDLEAETLLALMMMLREKDFSEQEHPYRSEIIRHCFKQFMFEIAAIFRKYRPNENIKLTRKEDILIKFLKLLSQHYKQQRSVQFYADALYVTSKHLTKTVKELTTKTCGEVIDEMVITEAKILLDDLELSVGNVADQLNFSDQYYFSRFFKKNTGVNPSEYKRRL